MNLRHPLILASNSPRRQELLKQAGFTFEVYTEDVEESYPPDMPVRKVAEYLAEKKSRFYRQKRSDSIILTADTTVIYHSELLEKPASADEAMSMLRALSGQVHEVVTGVCISYANQSDLLSVATRVYFKTLADAEIEHYVNNYRPLDKAGAYGIQEWIGMIGIKRIEGSYFNVVGLPVHEVYEVLAQYRL